jgi:2,3-bisphosphoglycerate-independent phosphoglycerate mutase
LIMSTPSPSAKYVHIFFMDGVGLGEDDPATNPFVRARLPALTAVLGEKWFLRTRGRITTERVSLVATDATLGMPGRPQSATGQATILTGHNVPQIVGEHYGPKPNAAVAAVVRENNLFKEVVATGGTAALLTPYPQGYFDGIESGRRLFSSVPLAASSAGLPLMTAADLRAGRAVSPDFTAVGWREHLGYHDIPLLSPVEAGRQIAALAQQYTFSFFEHWPSDRAGHRGSLEEAIQHLELLDTVLGSLIAAWDDTAGLLIITSDHGNIEEKNHRQHSLNPVPTLLVGPHHAELAAQIHDLTDIAAIVRQALGTE